MEVIVDTSLGQVLGECNRTQNGWEYFSFMGMRYAQPPIGDLRFKSPQPPKPWTGVYDARYEGNRSLSFTATGEIIGSEDCLFINVFTPTRCKRQEPKAVMFWIHGGGFYLGSGNKDYSSPDYLMEKDVILVTFNYRLGALGLMAFQTVELDATGNAALKDMVMALKWVQNNIAAFGGDPGNVTIFGQSAGAIAVHYLIASPMAKGLFHKAILQSGVGFLDIATPFKDNRDKMALKYASFAGLETTDEFEAYDFLKSLSGKEITYAFMRYLETIKNKYEGLLCAVVEPESCITTPFLTQDVELYYLENRVNTVPMIVGLTSMDGMVYAANEYLDGYMPPTFQDPELTVPLNLKIPRGSVHSIAMGEKIMDFYYQGEAPSRRNLVKYAKLQTDRKYTSRIQRMIRLHHSVSIDPVYLYEFTFDSPENIFKKLFNLKVPGVCHCDDLAYIFQSKYTNFRYDSPEHKTQQRITTFWTNFAKTGNPNPPEFDKYINKIWTNCENGTNYLQIGKYLVPKNDVPNADRQRFWDQIYEGYCKDLFFEENGYEIESDKVKDIRIQIQMTMVKNSKSK